MKVHFIGIGGTGIGPLALIAMQAGYEVSGSDKQYSDYVKYLKLKGINNIHIGTDDVGLRSADNVEWVVYSSAVTFENPNHPEIVLAKELGIRTSKRDEFLSHLISEKGLKLVAIAGTHGKTTTTAMAVWLFKQLDLPVSYSVGAKISFGEMGAYEQNSEYFVYECDEFDRNFLSFYPYLSIVTGVDWDHQEIYKTREEYQKAFVDFIGQSEQSVVWEDDFRNLNLPQNEHYSILNKSASSGIDLVGSVNREDAWQVVIALNKITNQPVEKLVSLMNGFPGVARRFEKLSENIYSDYAHTIDKIRGALNIALETNPNVVVVYEPLHNRRQHYIKEEYSDLFSNVKKLYWVPSYLAREDESQELLRPEDLIQHMNNKEIAEPAELDERLLGNIKQHAQSGDLVLCISAGSGGSLDEWLRKALK